MTKISVITSNVKGQRLKWFGHVKWREATNKARATIKWQLESKRPKQTIDGLHITRPKKIGSYTPTRRKKSRTVEVGRYR